MQRTVHCARIVLITYMLSDLYLKAVQVSSSSENTPELANYWQSRYTNLLEKDLFRVSSKTIDLVKLDELTRPATTFGELVLVNHLDKNGQLDEAALQTSIETAVRFLDGFLDTLNFNSQAKATVATYRKIGLGIADFKEYLSKRSNSSELDETDYLGNLISSATYRASESLAEEKGVCHGWDKVRKHLRPKSFEYWYDIETGDVKNGLEMSEDFSEDTIMASRYEIVPRRNVSLLLFPPDLEWQIWSDRDDTAAKTEMVNVPEIIDNKNNQNSNLVQKSDLNQNLIQNEIVEEVVVQPDLNSEDISTSTSQETDELETQVEIIKEDPIASNISTIDTELLQFGNEPAHFEEPNPALTEMKIQERLDAVEDAKVVELPASSENFLKPSLSNSDSSPLNNEPQTLKDVSEVSEIKEDDESLKLLTDEVEPLIKSDTKPLLNNTAKLMLEDEPELLLESDSKLLLEDEKELLLQDNVEPLLTNTPGILLDESNDLDENKENVEEELEVDKLTNISYIAPVNLDHLSNLDNQVDSEVEEEYSKESFSFQIGELVQLPKEKNKIYQVLDAKNEAGINKYQLTNGSADAVDVYIAEDEIEPVELFDILDRINLASSLETKLSEQDLLLNQSSSLNKGWEVWASALILNNGKAAVSKDSQNFPSVQVETDQLPEKKLIAYLEDQYQLHGRIIEEVGSSTTQLDGVSRLHLTYQVQVKESVLPASLVEVQIASLQESESSARTILNKYNRRQLYWQNQIDKAKKSAQVIPNVVNSKADNTSNLSASNINPTISVEPTPSNIHFNTPTIQINPNNMAKYSLKLEQLVQTQAFGDVTVTIQYDPEGPKVVMATGQAVVGELKHLLDTVLGLVNFTLSKKIAPVEISEQLQNQPKDGMNMPINDLLLIIAQALKTAPASAEQINSNILTEIVPEKIMQAITEKAEDKAPQSNPKSNGVEQPAPSEKPAGNDENKASNDKKEEPKNVFFGGFGGRKE